MKKCFILLTSLLILFSMTVICQAIDFSNAKPIKIACYGDSVTFGDLGNGTAVTPYPKRLETLLKDNYDNNNITVINNGICGLRSTEALNNYSNVLNENPNMIILMLGINDASGIMGGIVPIDTYENNLSQMVQQAQNEGIEVILLTPTPTSTTLYGVDGNKRIYKYSQVVLDVAKKYNVKCVDMYNKINTIYANKFYSNVDLQGFDWVHFTQVGYDLIADIVANYGIGLENSIFQMKENKTQSIPIVNSIFIQTDFKAINSTSEQYFFRNYYTFKDGSLGTYIDFPFYNEVKNVSLYLIAPITYAGGELKVYDNGNFIGKVNFYNEEIVYDKKMLIASNLSVGYHKIEFKTSNLSQVQSTYINPLMYFTEFEFTTQ